MERLRAFALRRLSHLRANVFRHGGNVGKAVERGLEIHAGAARHHRGHAARGETVERVREIGEIAADRVIHGGVDMAEEQMFDRALPLPAWAAP